MTLRLKMSSCSNFLFCIPRAVIQSCGVDLHSWSTNDTANLRIIVYVLLAKSLNHATVLAVEVQQWFAVARLASQNFADKDVMISAFEHLCDATIDPT